MWKQFGRIWLSYLCILYRFKSLSLYRTFLTTQGNVDVKVLVQSSGYVCVNPWNQQPCLTNTNRRLSGARAFKPLTDRYVIEMFAVISVARHTYFDTSTFLSTHGEVKIIFELRACFRMKILFQVHFTLLEGLSINSSLSHTSFIHQSNCLWHSTPISGCSTSSLHWELSGTSTHSCELWPSERLVLLSEFEKFGNARNLYNILV